MSFLELFKSNTLLMSIVILLAAGLVGMDILFYGSLRDIGWPGLTKMLFVGTLTLQLSAACCLKKALVRL